MKPFREEIKKLKEKTGVSYTRHHRQCKSNNGSDDPDNISIVPRHYHYAWHLMFSNMKPETIAQVISDRWIPKDCKFVCVPSDATVVVVKK
jgi:hypothetical protein